MLLFASSVEWERVCVFWRVGPSLAAFPAGHAAAAHTHRSTPHNTKVSATHTTYSAYIECVCGVNTYAGCILCLCVLYCIASAASPPALPSRAHLTPHNAGCNEHMTTCSHAHLYASTCVVCALQIAVRAVFRWVHSCSDTHIHTDGCRSTRHRSPHTKLYHAFPIEFQRGRALSCFSRIV